MKPKIGFNIWEAIKLIFREDFPQDFDFEERSRSHNGGGRFYIDPEFGEQHYQYEFVKNKVQIRFSKTSRLCYCQDSLFCKCHLKIWDDYESIDAFYREHYETILLSKKQVMEIMTPNLFTI